MGIWDAILGERGSEDRLRLKMGLMGLTHRPNTALMQQWSNDLSTMQAERKAAETTNRTAAFLRNMGTPQAMQAADALEAGMVDASTAYQMATAKPEPVDPWAGTKVVGGDVIRMGANGPEVIYSDPEAAAGGGVTYGLTPQRYVRPDGTIGLGVLGNDGTFKEVALPDGATPAPNVDRVDAGDRWILMDQQGNVVGEQPKNLEAAAAASARGTELGQAAGAAQASAASDIAAAETTLANIDSLRNHPGRKMGTGASSLFGYVPGTATREFQIEVERLKSGAFLTAIDQLRGMGALSNAEGQTATAAIAALDPTGTEEGFLKRLAEYEEIVARGLARARARIPAPPDSAQPSTPSATPTPPRRLRYNPETGALE